MNHNIILKILNIYVKEKYKNLYGYHLGKDLFTDSIKTVHGITKINDDDDVFTDIRNDLLTISWRYSTRDIKDIYDNKIYGSYLHITKYYPQLIRNIRDFEITKIYVIAPIINRHHFVYMINAKDIGEMFLRSYELLKDIITRGCHRFPLPTTDMEKINYMKEIKRSCDHTKFLYLEYQKN